MRFAKRVWLLAGLTLVAAGTAHAGPPSYLLLRRVEAPTHHAGGHSGARNYEARAHGYAYGYFGVCPNPQPQRQFGIYREYTQWSSW